MNCQHPQCGKPMELFEENVKDPKRPKEVFDVYLCHVHGIIKAYKRKFTPEEEVLLKQLRLEANAQKDANHPHL